MHVQALGTAFNLNKESVEVFSESFIRSHLIFQLSKVAEQILFHLRRELKLPPYITISPGPKDGVIGSIKQCYHLNDLIQIESLLGTSKNKYLILLDEADGTEEIPICVGGILLKHDLP